MSFAEAALLGLLQGLFEWLPVSSEGVVATAYRLIFGSSLSDAVDFSLWLHLGTLVSVLIAFRREIDLAVRSVLDRPTDLTPLVVFIGIATLTSAPIGFLVLVGLDEVSQRIGAAAMALVGVLMLITGAVLLLGRTSGERSRDDLSWVDAVLTGIAQGAAALPGLSRSGLTISVLLGRRVDRREALTLSFLLSIPASLGAGIYAAISSGVYASPQAILSLVVAAVTGFATIRVLLGIAQRINFGWFVVVVGLSIAAGSLWQTLG